MKRAFLALTMIAPLVSGLSAAPIGMILRVKGKVELIRASGTQAALPGEILEEGDRLKVESGELLISFCPESARFSIGPGTETEITGGGLNAIEGSAASRVGAITCSFPKVRLGEESLERVGALRPRGKPPIAVFLGGTVSENRPRFSWKPVPTSDRYAVRLLSEMGSQIWEQETADSTLDFPADRPALEDGWYSWELNAFQGWEIVAQQSTGFEVRLGSPLRPRPGEVAPDLLLPAAFEFEADGYFSEAAACLRRYLETAGRDDRLSQRLAWLYWKAGLLVAFNELANPEEN